MRRMSLTIAVLCALTLTGAAQQPLRFEVASVKPSPVQVVSPREAGGRLSLALPLRGLIARAYGIQSSQVVGGPPLMSQSFDISAKAENPNATPAELNQMLKSLLLDRFQLKAHAEMREANIWVLRIARNDGALGPRLKRSPRSCLTSEEYEARRAANTWVEPNSSDPCDRPPILFPVRRVGQPISNLVDLLRIMCCALIEDRTGLTGRYDWDVIEPTPASADPNASLSGPALFITELERQLGLKVEAAKGKVEFLVIDSVEAPTPD